MRNSWARCVALLLALALCAGAMGCGAQDEIDISCAEVAQAIWDSQPDMPAESGETASGGATWYGWLESVYDVVPDTILDGCVLYAQGGTYSDEVAVLRAADAQAARDAEDKLTEYLQRRLTTFAGYAPDEEYQLERALVARSGSLVALLAVPDASLARATLEDLLGGRTESQATPRTSTEAVQTGEATQQVPQVKQPTADLPAPAETQAAVPSVEAAPVVEQPQAEAPAQTPAAQADEYNHDAVLAAWQTQDPSSLAGKNLAVYQRAAEIIGNLTTPQMSDYDKELAIHDHLVTALRYDESQLGRPDTSAASPDSFTPYGGLVNGVVICYGYSSSFQLLMDMLGIPCLTVNGTVHDDNVPHSWNMVQLDGNWYHVDVGWDDPINGELTHRYFNRPSDDPQMLRSNRQWDRSAFPQAVGGPQEGPQMEN